MIDCYSSIKESTFNEIADQIIELMPTIKKDLLYIPFTTGTGNSIGTSEGGSLYWCYKECRKNLYDAKILTVKSDEKGNIKEETHENFDGNYLMISI